MDGSGKVMEGSFHTVHRQNSHGAREKVDKKRFQKRLRLFINNNAVIFMLMGFFIGRVTILNTLSPFGVSFLIAVVMSSDIKKTTLTALSIGAGILTKFSGYMALQAEIAMLAILLAIRLLKIDNKTLTIKAAAAAFGVNLIVALVFNPIQNGAFILNDALIGLFNATISMALIYIYNYSIPVISNKKRRSILSNEEIICLSIVCGIFISGLSDIFVYGISLKVILSVFIIVLSSYEQGAGAGASIGVTIGLISCISSNQVPAIVGAYGLCGMISGIFRDLGKIGTALGFITADIAVYFYLGGQNNIIGFKELIIGIILFSFAPNAVLKKILPSMDLKARSFIEHQTYMDRVKDIMSIKIARTVDVLGELSRALEEDSGSDKLRRNNDINGIINSTADRVCMECDAKNVCWNRDFYCTYQNIFQMVDTIQTEGSISMDTTPADMKKKCIKLGQMVKTMNYVYDIYRMNYKWRRKAQEGKKVVSEQLKGINGILKGISESLKMEVNFKTDVEEEIALALDREGIEFNDVVVVKNVHDRYEVNVYKKSCLGKRVCIKDVSPVISGVVKRKMERDKAYCMVKEDTNMCYFRLVESVKYQVTTGISREVKDKSGISGDNYSFIDLSDGRHMVVLSDGMGTGPSAALESSTAVTLLEKYLDAGFDKLSAIKAINSVMVLNSQDDNYATIDLAIINLYTGEAEFVKIGAVSTFIKRADGIIEVINSATLPMGILNDVDIESRTAYLNHGDFLIMITDGIQESGDRREGEWIVDALREIKSRNPQQIADELMERAKLRNNGSIVDDMTVLVSKVWGV